MKAKAATIDDCATSGDMNYLVPMRERAYFYEDGPPPGVDQTNMRYEVRQVPIRDARTLAHATSLDCEGFAFQSHRSAMTSFENEAEIQETYYREAKQLVAEATGAKHVVVFDHTLRRHMPKSEDRKEGFRLPAMRVHVDFTFESAPQRVRDILPENSERLLKGRVQFINVWRPVGGPAVDTPLALCNARSVSKHDLVSADLLYQNRKGAIYYSTFNPQHEWFYFPHMQPDEVLLFKNYDSLTDGRARCCPHSAFSDAVAPLGVRPRESIELRTMAFDLAP